MAISSMRRSEHGPLPKAIITLQVLGMTTTRGRIDSPCSASLEFSYLRIPGMLMAEEAGIWMMLEDVGHKRACATRAAALVGSEYMIMVYLLLV